MQLRASGRRALPLSPPPYETPAGTAQPVTSITPLAAGSRLCQGRLAPGVGCSLAQTASVSHREQELPTSRGTPVSHATAVIGAVSWPDLSPVHAHAYRGAVVPTGAEAATGSSGGTTAVMEKGAKEEPPQPRVPGPESPRERRLQRPPEAAADSWGPPPPPSPGIRRRSPRYHRPPSPEPQVPTHRHDGGAAAGGAGVAAGPGAGSQGGGTASAPGRLPRPHHARSAARPAIPARLLPFFFFFQKGKKKKKKEKERGEGERKPPPKTFLSSPQNFLGGPGQANGSRRHRPDRPQPMEPPGRARPPVRTERGGGPGALWTGRA